MAEGGGVGGLLAGIPLSTIIQVGTLGAMIVASWATLGGRITELEKDVARLDRDVSAIETENRAHENRLSVLETRYENLRDVVMELRRQSNSSEP